MNYNNYSKNYSEISLFDKFIGSAQKAGISVIYASLLLFYTLQKQHIPVWAKTTILGALGYFICPIDAIPDLTPVFGYCDDLSALTFALVTVCMFIDESCKLKAKNKLKDWFGNYNASVLYDIDSKLV